MGRVFKKLFGRKGAPKKDGNSTSKVESVRWVKKIILELSNMEGTPSYQLSHQLTVGSEVGNIVIADPSVSPRHCTFMLQDDVVSVIDHASVAGTIINGQKIPAGKSIILEETDTIKAGDLEIRILTENEAVEDEEDVEEEPEEEVEEKVEVKKTSVKAASANKKKVKSKTLAFSSVSSYSTNSLVRLLAVLSDFIIAYTLLIVFSPFDEFRSFVADVPVMIGELLQIDLAQFWAAVSEENQELALIAEDVYAFIAGIFPVLPLILLFFLIRFISTLLFGVSISELFLGVRSHGNAIWKRLGGALRVVIGMVTGPFIIFDVPAVISRRTVKEYVTFTHTYLTSTVFTIIGLIIYVPALVGGALVAPLFQGFEIPEPILVIEKMDRRVRVKDAPVASESVEYVSDHSSQLGVGLKFDPSNLSVIPVYKFSGQRQRLNFKPALAFYHRDLQRTVQVEIFKKFDLKELLGIGLRGNFTLYDRFPEMYDYVYSGDGAKSFKKTNDEKSNAAFAAEVVKFTKLSFSLGLHNAFDYMQTETPLLKSLIDYRSSFLALVEYKDFDQIGFFKIGNGHFLRISYNRQKPFDLLIPLMRRGGMIMKVEFDSKEQLSQFSSKFYKFNLEDSDWFGQERKAQTETFSPLQLMDLFSSENFKVDKISADTAQALYGYYFEKSAEVLKREDAIEYALWKNSVDGMFSVMEKVKETVKEVKTLPDAKEVEAPVETTEATSESLPETPVEEPAPDPRIKLFQNFQDLKDAVDNKNKLYFGAEEGFSV
jgi:hypothetical protein